MKKQIYAVLTVAAIAGVPFAAFAQAPQPSSYTEMPAAAPYDAAMGAYAVAPTDEGPRPSSLNNWPNMSQQPPAAAVNMYSPQGPRPSGH